MSPLTGDRPTHLTPVRSAEPLKLHDVPFELVPREVPFFLCNTPAGFPSPAQDDLQEPIDLGTNKTTLRINQVASRFQIPAHASMR